MGEGQVALAGVLDQELKEADKAIDVLLMSPILIIAAQLEQVRFVGGFCVLQVDPCEVLVECDVSDDLLKDVLLENSCDDLLT